MAAKHVRLAAAAVLAATLSALAALPAFAAQTEITSAGPLTRIIVSDDLTCQVAHRDDQQFELFGGELGSCGTFLAVGGTVYGPLTGGATGTPWTTVSQAPVVGNGSVGDPLRVVTVVDAVAAGLRLQQTDSYAVGSQSYRTDIQITNVGNEPRAGILYRGGDCYLQNDDTGYGRVDGGAPACIVNPAEGRRIEQWLPITPGSHYFEGYYGEVYSIIGSQEHFPDRCDCNEDLDNGAGLSWSVNVAPGQSVVISHETFFSPVGRGPVQTSFGDSVPDPTRISLDPVVVASSIAVTAGVIVLVPFPSALFNSTLEENYAEVMAGIGRIRAWLAGIWASILAWIRGLVAEQRARRATAAGSSPPPAGPPAVEPIAAPPAQVPPGGQSAAAARHDPWRTPLGMAGFIVATALLYAFLDPTFGFSLTSVATFVGLALGLFVVLFAYGLPLVLVSRSRGLPLTVRALPATLLVGVACVLISRFVNFQPGYLYGLIIGFFFAHGIPRAQEGRAEAIAAASSLLVAFVAWVALALLRGGAGGAGDLVTAMLSAATVTIVVAGLENAVFAMLPLRFLPGAAVYEWNRRVWIVLIALGLFGFAHVLLNPSAGYLADTTRTSFFTLILLLAAFGIASVLFWAWFRFRPKRQAPA
ncbi:MAG: FGLLP motif-containing membrane protein [Chloroflexota bacterium]